MVCYGQQQSPAQALQLLQEVATSKLKAGYVRSDLCQTVLNAHDRGQAGLLPEAACCKGNQKEESDSLWCPQR